MTHVDRDCSILGLDTSTDALRAAQDKIVNVAGCFTLSASIDESGRFTEGGANELASTQIYA